jgi:N-carbamoylputrescine amidase
VVVASLFEKRATGPVSQHRRGVRSLGEIAGKYRKMHIPDDPAFYEKFYFTPGDLGFEPIDTSVGRLGVLVCWDQWYPEAARLMALAGAELLLYPTAIGWDPKDDQAEKDRQREAWITVQRGHAVANGLPLLSCNRTGYEADPSECGVRHPVLGHQLRGRPARRVLGQGGTDKRELLWPRSIWRAASTCAEFGRSCAIAASTPMPTCCAVFVTEAFGSNLSTRLACTPSPVSPCWDLSP